MSLTRQEWAQSQSYLLRKLLSLLHGLLHNLWHSCRWFLCLALFKFIDFVTVVGMVGIIRVEEIKLWVVDLILANPSFKLGPVPVITQDNSSTHRNILKNRE